MADYQDLTMQLVERDMFQLFSALIGTISDVSIFTLQQVENIYLKNLDKRTQLNEGGEKTFQQFKELLRKHPPENVLSLRVTDSELADYRRFLKEDKKTFVLLDDLKTDSHIIMFRGRDRSAVEAIQNKVDIIHRGRTEIHPNTFLDAFHNSTISTASGLNRHELELFRHFVKSDPCLFATVGSDNGKYTLMYKPEDKERINQALHYSNWLLKGSYRELVREQIEYRIKGRNKLVQDLQDAQKEFYIVSKNLPKNYVHVTEKEFVAYKNGQELENGRVSREDPAFQEKVKEKISALSTPVIFEPHEFTNNIPERSMLADSKMSLDVLPGEILVQEEMIKYNRLRDLISYKMGMDNENEANWGLYDTSVSFSEYYGHEQIDDADFKNQLEKDFQEMKSCFKDTQTRIKREDIPVSNDTLDYIIASTEKELQAANQTVSREHSVSRDGR